MSSSPLKPHQYIPGRKQAAVRPKEDSEELPYDSEIVRLREKNKKLREHSRDIVNKFNSLEKDLKDVRRQKEALSKKYEQDQERMLSLEERNSKLNKDGMKAIEVVKGLKKKNEAAVEKIKEMRNEKKSSVDHVGLKEQIKKRGQAIEDLKKLLEEEKKKNNDLVLGINSERALVEGLREKLKGKGIKEKPYIPEKKTDKVLELENLVNQYKKKSEGLESQLKEQIYKLQRVEDTSEELTKLHKKNSQLNLKLEEQKALAKKMESRFLSSSTALKEAQNIFEEKEEVSQELERLKEILLEKEKQIESFEERKQDQIKVLREEIEEPLIREKETNEQLTVQIEELKRSLEEEAIRYQEMLALQKRENERYEEGQRQICEPDVQKSGPEGLEALARISYSLSEQLQGFSQNLEKYSNRRDEQISLEENLSFLEGYMRNKLEGSFAMNDQENINAKILLKKEIEEELRGEFEEKINRFYDLFREKDEYIDRLERGLKIQKKTRVRVERENGFLSESVGELCESRGVQRDAIVFTTDELRMLRKRLDSLNFEVRELRKDQKEKENRLHTAEASVRDLEKDLRNHREKEKEWKDKYLEIEEQYREVRSCLEEKERSLCTISNSFDAQKEANESLKNLNRRLQMENEELKRSSEREKTRESSAES